VHRFLARKKYLGSVRNIILVQSIVRRWLARRVYRKLKMECRSVEHVKKLSMGLEKKNISLQQKIEELVSDLLSNW
jgi:myosin-5